MLIEIFHAALEALGRPYVRGMIDGVVITLLVWSGVLWFSTRRYKQRMAKKREEVQAEVEELRNKAVEQGSKVIGAMGDMPGCPSCGDGAMMPTDMLGVILEVTCRECDEVHHAICSEGGVSIGKIVNLTGDGAAPGEPLH